VNKYLCASDYGILLRENSITNQVASPVKFAEYLSAGLKILISENLGDYSEFVTKNKCGTIISGKKEKYKFETVSYSDKINLYKLAENNFRKSSYINQYQQVVDSLNS
jgi:hypothetical protein